MDFRTFQAEARKTDQVVGDGEKSILVPLLGLAGEVGSLLTEYKKYLRDGRAHVRFQEQVAEDLGDLLWYVSNVATKFALDLESIAEANIEKTRNRWSKLADADGPVLFDDGAPAGEQIPRHFRITFSETIAGSAVRVTVTKDGNVIGDPITDNAYENDGYRFHDVFHFSYAAILGWSPITRTLLRVKRKSAPSIDEVEDGARAKIIEEMISQLVYVYAREHNFLDGVVSVDYQLLKAIQALVADREVRSRPLVAWERAILEGYRVWRHIRQRHGGTVEVDLLGREIRFVE